MPTQKQKTLPFSTSASRPSKIRNAANAVGKLQNDIQHLNFRFIDLFAGIGGLRIGLEKVGGRCVFSSEIDSYAQKTYTAWFGEAPVGDIKDFEDGTNVPEHELRFNDKYSARRNWLKFIEFTKCGQVGLMSSV